MGGEWGTRPLGDLVDDIVDRRGVTPKKLGSDFTTSGFRVISAKAIRARDVDLESDDPRFVDEPTIRKWMRTPILADDVILTSEAPLGEPAYIRRDVEWCLGQRLFGIRTKKEHLHGRFLFYALQSPGVRHDLLSRATGTTAQGIRQSELRLVQVPVPDLAAQHATAKILGALDDKIDLNRRMSETLEAMARALFKSWFVDFDPVRAKAEGREPGLPLNVAEAFPDLLEESESGEIPAGWTRAPVHDLAEVNPEVWTAATRPNVIRYVDLSSTKWGRIEAIAELPLRDAPSRAQRVLRPGDTIVGTVRPANGAYALIGGEGLTGSTGFAVLRPREPELAELVYLAVTAPENIQELGRFADGGAYPAVRPEIVGASPAIRPGFAVIAAFSAAVRPMFSRVAGIERESRTLAALRDTLLPKLISGELRIPDAERIVGEVA